MYLNVNLTPPPPTAGEGSCTTPKTPEILNSLINLTSPPLPHSYHQYQNQIEGGTLLSPISDFCSPSEESAAMPLNAARTGRLDTSSSTMAASQLEQLQSPTASGFPSSGGGGGGGGGGGLVGGSPGTSGTGGPLAGASPPSTPDLPSPVNTVEATKSALIKEGLKLQIRTKLQAAGFENPDPYYGDLKYIKDEGDEVNLTEEDEERRRKRRERNKIAATKCRNKKKEKTIVLMTESESVEDMNVRLKTEIQRLTSEKMNLEKLLRDPNHRASCRHTPRCPKAPKLPLVIVTPADSPDASSSSSSSSSSCSSSSESPTSPPMTGPISYKPTHSQASSVMASPPGNNTPSTNASSCASTSSSPFLAPKYSSSQNQRHHPYQLPGRSQHQPQCATGVVEKQQYCNPPSPSGCLPKLGYNYQCMNVPRTHEFTPPNPPSSKSVYTSPKSRGSLVRYSPYSGRPPPVPSPLVTHTHPQPGTVCGDSYHNNNNSGCGREDQQSCISDIHTNQFFPPCSYSSM